MGYKNTAVVLGLFDTGLGVVRSLGRKRIPVIGVDSNPAMPGFSSRYCESKICPDPVHQPEDLLDFLMGKNVSLESPGLLLPATDAFFHFLARYRRDLAERYLFSLPPDRLIEGMINKRIQYEIAERAGMPLPKTFFPDTMTDVDSIKGQLDYPALVKPNMGHLWRDRLGTQAKGIKVFTATELIQGYEEIFGAGLQAMVQTIIPGPNTNHYKVNVYIGVRGDLQALFTLRKIRQSPPEFGVGSCVESIHDPELAELGKLFFERIHYRGVGSIEFKRDERDGRLKMIELNPRFWQQNMLATDCGVNFPFIEYMDLIGQPLEPVTEFKIGVKWLDLLLDWRSYREYSKNGNLSIRGWLRSWRGVRSFPVFALDDLSPFLKKYHYGSRLFRPIWRAGGG